MCTLSDIKRWCGSASGGLKKLQLIRLEDVESLPRTGCLTSIGNIALKSGLSAYDIIFDRQTGRLLEQQIIDDEAGDYFERTINFQVRRDRPAALQLIIGLLNKRVHVIAFDRNDQYIYLPYMRLSSSRDTGQRYSDVHRANFTLTGRFADPARFFASSPGLPGGEEMVPEPSAGNNNTAWYQQEFSSMQSNTLVWTQNGGYVPTNKGQYQVFQNGQLLHESLGQYSVNRSAGANQTHFIISNLTHFNGSNYQVFTRVNE